MVSPMYAARPYSARKFSLAIEVMAAERELRGVFECEIVQTGVALVWRIAGDTDGRVRFEAAKTAAAWLEQARVRRAIHGSQWAREVANAEVEAWATGMRVGY